MYSLNLSPMKPLKFKGFLIAVLAGVLFWALAEPALAAIQLPDELRPINLPEPIEPAEATTGKNPETAATQTLILFVGQLVSRVLLFVGALTIIFIIISATHYILAFGKQERINKGKTGLFWAVLGLLIVLVSYALVQGVIALILQVDSSVG